MSENNQILDKKDLEWVNTPYLESNVDKVLHQAAQVYKQMLQQYPTVNEEGMAPMSAWRERMSDPNAMPFSPTVVLNPRHSNAELMRAFSPNVYKKLEKIPEGVYFSEGETPGAYAVTFSPERPQGYRKPFYRKSDPTKLSIPTYEIQHSTDPRSSEVQGWGMFDEPIFNKLQSLIHEAIHVIYGSKGNALIKEMRSKPQASMPPEEFKKLSEFFQSKDYLQPTESTARLLIKNGFIVDPRIEHTYNIPPRIDDDYLDAAHGVIQQMAQTSARKAAKPYMKPAKNASRK